MLLLLTLNMHLFALCILYAATTNMFEVSDRSTKKVLNMFKANNKNTTTTSFDLVWYLYC